MADLAALRAELTGAPLPPAPALPAEHGRHLPAELAATLEGLIAAHPDASHGAIAALMERRTGRRVARTTVEGRRGGTRPGRRVPLTAREREVLLGLLRSDPRAPRAEVARRFEVATGRPLDRRTVSAHALDRADQPRRGPGRPRVASS